MTFDAFFLKKKIDLDLLKVGKPDVFAEFVSHFEQMSEKSFDHTKKYWFNNLRIAYPLSEEKELALKEAFKAKVENVAVDVDAVTISAQTPSVSNPPAFKSRFKAVTNRIEEGDKTVVEAGKPEKSEPVLEKPAGFKPRFKAGATKAVESSSDKQEVEKIDDISADVPAVAKPAGFKPRFRVGTTKPAEAVEKTGEVKAEEAITAKAVGFKPRFKAGVTKPAETSEVKEEIIEEPAVTKPAGFTPRFKAGVAKPAEVTEADSKTENDKIISRESEEVAKPVGFKPRFKTTKKED